MRAAAVALVALAACARGPAPAELTAAEGRYAELLGELRAMSGDKARLDAELAGFDAKRAELDHLYPRAPQQELLDEAAKAAAVASRPLGAIPTSPPTPRLQIATAGCAAGSEALDRVAASQLAVEIAEVHCQQNLLRAVLAAPPRLDPAPATLSTPFPVPPRPPFWRRAARARWDRIAADAKEAEALYARVGAQWERARADRDLLQAGFGALDRIRARAKAIAATARRLAPIGAFEISRDAPPCALAIAVPPARTDDARRALSDVATVTGAEGKLCLAPRGPA